MELRLKLIIIYLSFVSCSLFGASGSWNGVAFTAWNGIAQTAWNGTSISCAGGGGGGTPAFVQDDGTSFDPFNSSRSVTFTSSTTAGSMIVAVYRGENASTLSVSDNKSGSYTTVVNGSTSGIAIAAAYNTSGGASHQVTFTVTSTSNPGDIIILEYSSIATSSAFDVGSQNSSFIANISTTTAATSQATELIFGAMFKASTAPTAGSGFTIRMSQGTLYTEDKNVTSTGAQTVNFTHAEATAAISAATFKSN